MKRDMDLARTILLAIEEHEYTDQPYKIDIPGFSNEEVSYHIKFRPLRLPGSDGHLSISRQRLMKNAG